MNRPLGSWPEANQRYLSAALRRLALRLEPDRGADAELVAQAERALAEAAAALPGPSSLDTLQRIFGLSAFEREVVLLCAGFELDAEYAARLAPPTFSLALATLPDPHWSALTPARPLRHHRLVHVQGPGTLVASALRIDERVLHYLTGIRAPDARLEGIVESLGDADAPLPSHEPLVDAAADAWERAPGVPPVIELWGPDADARRAVAAAVCERLGFLLYRLYPDALGREGDERLLLRLLARESLLDGVAFLIESDDAGDGAQARRLLEHLGAPLFLAARDRGRRLRRPSLALEVRRPSLAEQRALFEDALRAERLDRHAGATHGIDQVIAQFDLGAPAIREICECARRAGSSAADADLGDELWDGCRRQARAHLEELAQRIDGQVGWSDLVVPEAQQRTLREIGVRVRQRARVYDRWGFAAKGARGLGISALFCGPSGTGKTLAAEVIARELRLDLYRVDLSQVVSKYIGETERNLRRVFDAAEEGAAVLLFDEADALFGKRSEVKDSHDRYANIEIGYLLQRMEAYRGLAILTTNFRSALDQAFVRRLAFVVEFPMPDLALRAEIWRGVFPAETPTEALDHQQLARLALSGGNIRNVALAAAFLAAEEGSPVRMGHVAAAARGEYAKLERPLPTELAKLG